MYWLPIITKISATKRWGDCCFWEITENADAASWACLLTNITKESGAYLNALPLSSLRLWMDDSIVCIAVGLCIGSPLCRLHTCHHCRTDKYATHIWS